jgi:prepilin-type N-terminal cleavage/methylation domain-containing protein
MPRIEKTMNITFHNLSHRAARHRVSRRHLPRASTRGFTLLEVMITLALMMIMLAIVFVPLNSAFNIFGIGRSRNGLQVATRQTLVQLESDLQKAVYVFPNSTMPGITDKAPYNGAPPYISGSTCGGTRVSNTSRIDMLLPLRDNEIYPIPTPQAKGSVVNPVRPAYYLVTYYARRANPDSNVPFDPITNPIQLFRAKMPYKNSDGTYFLVSGKKNIEMSGARYSACDDDTSRWLMQDDAGANKNEPLNLEYDAANNPRGKTRDADGTPVIAGSHDLVSPRDLALLPAQEDGTDLRPRGTNFVCEDANGDGKIDRVTVSLTLAQYDLSSVGSSNGKPTYQQHSQTETINLTNVR